MPDHDAAVDRGPGAAGSPPHLPNLLPAFILRQHAAGEERGRFPAASLFVDISGFTAATNALVQHGSKAAEAMADVMLGVFEPLVDAIYAQGGWITTFAGDAFSALFPEEQFETAAQACLHALAAGVAAGELLQAAHDRLQEQAARIPDEETRRVFMDVPAHREIRQLYQARTGPQAVPAEAAAGSGADAVEPPAQAVLTEIPGESLLGEPGPAPTPVTIQLDGPVSGSPAGEGGTAPAAITVNLDDLLAELLAGVEGNPEITLVISKATLNLYGCSIRLLGETEEGTPRRRAKRGKKGRRDRQEGGTP